MGEFKIVKKKAQHRLPRKYRDFMKAATKEQMAIALYLADRATNAFLDIVYMMMPDWHPKGVRVKK